MIPGIIGGALNLGLGMAGQAFAQSQNYKYTKKLFDYTSDYNAPVNQMARLREAGLNPSLMYGNIMGGSQSAVPMQTPYQPGNADLVSSFNKSAERRLLDAQADRFEAEAEEIRARTPGHEVNIENTRTDTDKKKAEIDNIRQNTFKIEREIENLEAHTSNLYEQNKNLEKIREHLDSQIGLLKQQRLTEIQRRYLVVAETLLANAQRLNVGRDTQLKTSQININSQVAALREIEKEMYEEIHENHMNNETARTIIAGLKAVGDLILGGLKVK